MSPTWPVVAVALLCLAAPPSTAGDPAAAGCDPCNVRVMSFNIEWGGAHVRFASVAEAINAADADIAGIQEPEGNLERLALELGWHFSRRNHVISRYPLIDPPGGDGRFVFVEVTPGAVVAVANVHLPSDPYGPYWLREGRETAEVLALEREVRLAQIAPLLETLEPIHRRGVPVFLTGDFNAPSHEDWTEATAGQFPHRVEFGWPVSRAVAAAGFVDSYRAMHADPVASPGFTWWAARPAIADYNPSDPGDQDRIDFVWSAGPSQVVDSRLVGEAGGRDVAAVVSPWPSDHRAVVSEFSVRAAPMPVLVTTNRRVYRGAESVGVRWRATDEASSMVLLREEDGDLTPQVHVAAPSSTGTLEVPASDLPPGAYVVALVGSDGRIVSRNEFWLLERNAEPSIAVSADTLTADESLPLAWRNAPGNRLDWIAIVHAGQASRGPVAYTYVGARSSGTLELNALTARAGWPLPPGRYVARLLADDAFEVLAESAPFVVESDTRAP